MTVLVVYFSKSGNTKRIAEELAAACGGDLERIEEARPKTGIGGLLAGLGEVLFGRTTAITAPSRDPAQYDLVLLGTPIWAWSPTPAIRAYIDQNAAAFRKVGFFCTLGGAGDVGAFRRMAERCGQEPVATLRVTEDEVRKGGYRERLDAFVREATA